MFVHLFVAVLQFFPTKISGIKTEKREATFVNPWKERKGSSRRMFLRKEVGKKVMEKRDMFLFYNFKVVFFFCLFLRANI